MALSPPTEVPNNSEISLYDKSSKYLNEKDVVMIPNLTYYPRATFLPKNTITDGSVALLTLKNGSRLPTEFDLAFYGTKEFEKYYKIEETNFKIEDKEKEATNMVADHEKIKADYEREMKLLKKIIENRDQELSNHKKVMEMQSKELLEVEKSAPMPNTAKSYVELRKPSYKNK